MISPSAQTCRKLALALAIACFAATACAETSRFVLPGEALALSPDGKLVACVDEDEILIANTASAITVARFPLDERVSHIDFQHAAWSPDSRWLAFTDDAARYMKGGYLFVMDTGTGKSTVLDDTPKTKDPTGLRYPIDSLPAWNSDSRTIIFQRVEKTGDGVKSSLMRWDLAKKAPSLLYTFPLQRPYVLYDGNIVFDQKNAMFFSYASYIGGADLRGIQRASVDGKNPTLILPARDVEQNLGVLAIGGERLLLRATTDNFYSPNPYTFSLLRISDLSVTRVGDETQFVCAACFSPDASSVAFVYRNRGDSNLMLRIETLSGGKRDIELPADFYVKTENSFFGIGWSSDRNIVLTGIGLQFLNVSLF